MTAWPPIIDCNYLIIISGQVTVHPVGLDLFISLRNFDFFLGNSAFYVLYYCISSLPFGALLQENAGRVRLAKRPM